MILQLCTLSSYMYAVSMARHIDHQIENKRTATLDVTKACGTIWDLRTAFSHMRDLCLPGTALTSGTGLGQPLNVYCSGFVGPRGDRACVRIATVSGHSLHTM